MAINLITGYDTNRDESGERHERGARVTLETHSEREINNYKTILILNRLNLLT